MFRFTLADVERVATPALFIFVFGWLVTKQTLKNTALTLGVCLLKMLIFATSYMMFFEGFPNNDRPDDIVYIRSGASLLHQLHTKPFADISLVATAQSFHFFYIMPAALAIQLFGLHYYSLVALNVAVSFLAAGFAYAIIRRRYENESLARWIFIIMVLHPDVVAWTSFFAGKDTWVLLGHTIFILGFVQVESGKRLSGLLWILLASALTLNLRFYLPVIMGALIVLHAGKSVKIWFLAFVVGILALLPDTVRALQSLMRGGAAGTSIDFVRLAVAIPHFWLTPRPFFEDEIHGFLRFGAIVSWMVFPIMITGMYRSLLSKDRFARFILMYFLTFSLFYGITEFLNGPRQRLQLVFAQIFFIWVGLSYFKLIPARLRLLTPPQTAATPMPALLSIN